jgi:hypothetical protein
MHDNILLVNPPIYDFSAYDFWLKPYGLLRVAGFLRGQVAMRLFDYLDRYHPGAALPVRSDPWGRGPFMAEVLPKPAPLAWLPRHYRRYGIPRQYFRDLLATDGPFAVALIQTGMTYWYPGVREVIEDIRAYSPQTTIVLGGVYATLCPQHANGLGADLVIEKSHLEPLWQLLGVTPRLEEPPLWEAYPTLQVGTLKLTDGCPFRCTYCSVPQVYPPFQARPPTHAMAELTWLCQRGVCNIAFYDDALLFRPEQILLPFLQEVRRRDIEVHFHTPNALNARFMTPAVASAMVQAGFKTFYLGFESTAYQWQRRTGGKVYADELARAVEHLVKAGAAPHHITAYLIIAHPFATQQDIDASMQYAHSLGMRLMLSEFSPIPGTPDGERCRQWVDLDEPLWHNKTAFTAHLLGLPEVQRLKRLCRQLNQRPFSLDGSPNHFLQSD